MFRRIGSLSVFLIILLCGCGRTASQEYYDKLEKENRRLSEEIADLKDDYYDLKEENDTLSQQLDILLKEEEKLQEKLSQETSDKGLLKDNHSGKSVLDEYESVINGLYMFKAQIIRNEDGSVSIVSALYSCDDEHLIDSIFLSSYAQNRDIKTTFAAFCSDDILFYIYDPESGILKDTIPQCADDRNLTDEMESELARLHNELDEFYMKYGLN